MVATPVVLVVLQRVFIPARALMYTLYFLVLLGVVVADYVARQWPSRWIAKTPLAMLVLLLAFRVSELVKLSPTLHRSQMAIATVASAYQWLRTQPTGPVYIGSSLHGLLFHHYGLLDQKPLNLHFKPATKAHYRYLVWPSSTAHPPAWAMGLPYQVVYHDAMVNIFALRDAQAESK
jgi:hypothetical protein